MQDKKAVLCLALNTLIILSAITAISAFIHPDGSEDNYFETFGPRMDKLIIKKYADLDAEMTALQNGEIDITDYSVNAEWANNLASDPNVGLADYGGEAGYYTINFNQNNNTYLGNPPDPAFPNPVYPNPMSELALRQACAYFINRTALTEDVGQGLYDPIYTPIPPYMTYWIHPEIRPGGTLENLTYPFDSTYTTAAALLDNGGLPMGPDGWRYWDMNRNGIKDSGEDFTLKIYPRTDSLRANATQMLEAGFASALIRIHSVRISTKVSPHPGVSKDYHILFAGWIAIGPNPEYLYTLYSWDNYYHDGSSNSPNYGSISKYDPVMQEQLRTMENGLNESSVFDTCLAFQVRFAETASEVPLASVSAPKAYNKWYTGGNDGVMVDPDDGENKYRGHDWENMVNGRGTGENCWFTTLNAYPQGSPFGDGNMTMRYGWEVADMPQNLNPLNSNWFWENEIIGRIFDTLACRDPMTNGPAEIPQLIENWTTGVWVDPNDGLEKSKVTLTVRPGVFWSDGVPFTIEDVIYNVRDLPRELAAKLTPPWWMMWTQPVVACYRLDEHSADILLNSRLPSSAVSDEVLLWKTFYCAKGTPWIVPKHLWQPFIALHEESEITGDLSVTHPEMLVGTGPFVFVENTPSSLTLARNPHYYGVMNTAALHYRHFNENKIIKGMTVTALSPSTQIRPYKIRPSSWTADGQALLTVPLTNMDTSDSTVVHEKIELLRPGNVEQILLDEYDKILTPLQISPENLELHNLEKGEYTIRVTVEVTSGELYNFVTSNLPPELWYSALGPKTVERHFWVTTQADVNEDGVVNILDIAKVATTFGLAIGQPGFDTIADVNTDYKTNILDIVKIAMDYGWHY